MNKYIEFFVGGPLDGMDKTDEFDVISFGIRFDELWTYEDYQRDPNMNPDLVGTVRNQWLYTPQRFTFGGITFQFWADMRLMSREMIALRLAELIMEPHIKRENPQMCSCTDSVYSGGECPKLDDDVRGDARNCPKNNGTLLALKAAKESEVPE